MALSSHFFVALFETVLFVRAVCSMRERERERERERDTERERETDKSDETLY